MLCSRILLGLVLSAALIQAAAPERAAAQGWPSWLGGGAGDAPGTSDWWKANKGKAEFVPGEGYRVPGVDGYFDELGRRIDAPASETATMFVDPDDEPGGLFPQIDPKNSFRKVRSAMGGAPDQQQAESALAEGERLFQAKQYPEAAKQCRSAIAEAPDSMVADRAHFLLAECYFFQDKYQDARNTYDELVSRQPNTRDLDTLVERQWAIAKYWEAYYFDYKQHSSLRPNWTDKTRPMFDTIGHAIKTYDSIRLNDPTGPRADDAIMATAGIYFRRGRYFDADEHYTLLRREYPRSEHQFDAHILGLQSKLRKYQGADYDGTAIDEAKQLLKQIRTQFAGRLTDEEKQRLVQVQAELQLAVEKRDLTMAQYYDNTEHYGAAKQYYARISNDHAGSPIAQQAQQRLAQLGGLPEQPAPRLSWFVGLFPENRERSRVAQVAELTGETRLAENPQGGSNSSAVTPASATSTR